MNSLLLLLLQLTLSSSLLLRKVSVPPYSLEGESARLVCDFDPQGEQIYSVKWYKAGQEVFRVLPSTSEETLAAMTVYPRPGVVVSKVCSFEDKYNE